MAERKKVYYTYQSIEEYEKNDHEAIQIVKEDTGVEHWPSNKALPPTSYPPPLSAEAIEKLQKIEGLIVEEVED